MKKRGNKKQKFKQRRIKKNHLRPSRDWSVRTQTEAGRVTGSLDLDIREESFWSRKRPAISAWWRSADLRRLTLSTWVDSPNKSFPSNIAPWADWPGMDGFMVACAAQLSNSPRDQGNFTCILPSKFPCNQKFKCLPAGILGSRACLRAEASQKTAWVAASGPKYCSFGEEGLLGLGNPSPP